MLFRSYIYTLVPEFLMRFIVWMLIHSVYRLEKSGLDKIPDQGPAVIVSNHVSFVDALVIAAACPRPIRFVMDHRIFRLPILSFVFRTSRAIPIAPAKEDPAMMERAFEEVGRALKDGDLVAIFRKAGSRIPARCIRSGPASNGYWTQIRCLWCRLRCAACGVRSFRARTARP